MRKLTIFFFSCILAPASVWASTVEYTFTLNTSSISGTTGSVDFALDPGAGSDQSLTATVTKFSSTGSYGGTETLTGNASGGPVTTGSSVTLLANNTTADNDDLESFTFGNTLTFTVDLSGAALSAPDGLATSPYEFIFSTYSDAAGTTPVLTTDAGGASGTIEISPEGVASTSKFSSQLGMVATPEPHTLWMLCFAVAIIGGVRYARRVPTPGERH